MPNSFRVHPGGDEGLEEVLQKLQGYIHMKSVEKENVGESKKKSKKSKKEKGRKKPTTRKTLGDLPVPSVDNQAMPGPETHNSNDLGTSSVSSWSSNVDESSISSSSHDNSRRPSISSASSGLDTASTISLSSASSGGTFRHSQTKTRGYRLAESAAQAAKPATGTSATSEETHAANDATSDDYRGRILHPQRRGYSFTQRSYLKGDARRRFRKHLLPTMKEEDIVIDPGLLAILTDVPQSNSNIDVVPLPYIRPIKYVTRVCEQAHVHKDPTSGPLGGQYRTNSADDGAKLMKEDSYAAAEKIFRAEISIHSEDGISNAFAKAKLSHCLHMQFKNKEAFSSYEDAIGELQDLLGVDHESVALCAFGLAKVAIQIGFSNIDEEKIVLAEELLEIVVESREKQYGTGSAETMPWVQLLALIYYKSAGNFEKAEGRWMQVLEHQANNLGKKHRDTCQTARYVAICLTWRLRSTAGVAFLRRRGQYACALALSRRLAVSSFLAVCLAAAAFPILLPAILIENLYKDMPRKFPMARTNLAYHRKLSAAGTAKRTPAPERKGHYSKVFKMRTVGGH